MQRRSLRDALEPVIRRLRFAVPYAYGAAVTAFTFTAGVFTRRHRARIVEICHRAGYAYGVEPARLPRIAIDALTPADCAIVVPEPLGADGNVSAVELIAIDRLVRARAPRVLFEFGTFDGRTTLNLAANAPRDARVITLDLPQEHASDVALAIAVDDAAYIAKPVSGARYRGTPWASRIEQLYGDSATIDLERWRGGVDLVFIDASHAYDYVMSDSRRAMALLRGGQGTILWHDYGHVWAGVTRALHDLRDREPAFAGLRHIEGTSLAVLDVGMVAQGLEPRTSGM